MAEWKRVKDKRTGHEYSVVNVNEEHHEVLDKEAVASDKPKPPKPNVSKADGQSAGRRSPEAPGSQGPGSPGSQGRNDQS
jgi:hypothetical protein